MSSCETTDKFNVVILYDDFTSAGRAMAAYSHLTRELGNEFTPELSIWRIDVAASQECAAQADHDIGAAEMVIMAVRGGQPCPAAFLRWTEGAVEGGVLPRRVLIAIIEAADDPVLSAGTWNSVLCGAAAQIQMDVFLWAPHAAADNPALPAQFSGARPARGDPALEALQDISQTG